MPTRNRPRPPQDHDRSSSSEASFSPLEEEELNAFSEEELDHMFAPGSNGSSNRFGRIATATGIGMMLILSLYLIAEFTTMGFLSSSLGIGMVGMMMALIGFGVFSGRDKKTAEGKSSSKSTKASVEEKVEAKLREARAALDAENAESGAGSSSRLRRSSENKLFGVCAGLGEYFGLDVTLVRAAFLIGLLLSAGQMTIVYLGLAYIMPKPEDA